MVRNSRQHRVLAKSRLGVKVKNTDGRTQMLVSVILSVEVKDSPPLSTLKIGGKSEVFDFAGGPRVSLTLGNIADIIASEVVKTVERYRVGGRTEKEPIGFNIVTQD